MIDLVRFLDDVDFRAAVERLTGERNADYRPRPNPPPVDRSGDDVERERAKAGWFWSRRRPITGTAAEVYLRRVRGYDGVIPPTLAFLPAHGDHPPALIAAFGIATEPEPGELVIDDGAVMAVQITKLSADGSDKADVEPSKIIIGRGALGSPIVAAPPNDLLGLAICEGLEDALSIHAATGLGAWASGGAGRMPALAATVPQYIDFVTVGADRNAAGVKGAKALADGLRERKISHVVTFPDGEIVA